MPSRFSPLIRWALLVVLPLAAACARESGPSLAAPEALELARAHKLTIVDIRRPEEWRQTGVAQGAKRIDMRQPGGPKAFVEALVLRDDDTEELSQDAVEANRVGGHDCSLLFTFRPDARLLETFGGLVPLPGDLEYLPAVAFRNQQAALHQFLQRRLPSGKRAVVPFIGE